jgi:hypothetical protein
VRHRAFFMRFVKLRWVPSLRMIKNHVELLLYDNLVVDASQTVARGILFECVS